jgi:putative FmdB family regulatory protein
MPFYEYEVIGDGCPYCTEGFEELQKMKDAHLRACPKCGALVRRIISRANISKDILGNANLKEKGFTKLVRKDKGVYEKVN